MAVNALRAHKERQAAERVAAGGQWSGHDLVFSTWAGGALGAANVRREFKAACRAAELWEHWTPREKTGPNAAVPVMVSRRLECAR